MARDGPENCAVASMIGEGPSDGLNEENWPCPCIDMGSGRGRLTGRADARPDDDGDGP